MQLPLDVLLLGAALGQDVARGALNPCDERRGPISPSRSGAQRAEAPPGRVGDHVDELHHADREQAGDQRRPDDDQQSLVAPDCPRTHSYHYTSMRMILRIHRTPSTAMPAPNISSFWPIGLSSSTGR